MIDILLRMAQTLLYHLGDRHDRTLALPPISSLKGRR